MSLSRRYRQLAALIEALESHGVTVQQAEPVDGRDGEQSPTDRFAVRLCVELPTDATVNCLDPETSADPEEDPLDTNTAVSQTEPRIESEQEGDEVAAGASRDEATATGSDEEAEAVDDVEADESPQEPVQNPAENDTTTDDSTVRCTHHDCDRTFETARGMKIHRTKAHPLSELAGEMNDRAVHHDPDVLARVYDEYETFAEMTEALDVDVGAQAVRKQMIRHGIHEPGAGNSTDGTPDESDKVDETPDESDEAAETPGDSDEADDTGADHTTEEVSVSIESQPAANGGKDDADSSLKLGDSTSVADRLPDLDLPGTLSTEDLQTAVEEANTLYDVQRALDLDQETTRDVLAEYDLLELVSGRAASLRDREELKAEIGQRIRRAAT